ncbi:hypothetical protein DID99_05935 [Burkholderia sp. Bp8986]|nr:hypothetical protein DID99_05935 [Burkholderia sp. Bp8986]
MKIHHQLAALAACCALTGLTYAGPTSPQAVVKKITLTANIGDSLFVSRPDNSALGDVVELNATGGAQQTVGATLPIRVRATNPDINVVLLRPSGSPSGVDGLADVKVGLTDNAGNRGMVPGAGRPVRLAKRGHDGFDGYDETHDVKISAHVQDVRGTGQPTVGRNPASVVLVFEPAASAGREPAVERVSAVGE